MQRTLIFATNNQNKVKEIRAVLDDRFQIITLREAGIDIDIPEPHDSLEANATEKSSVIYRITGKDCFSEDTGLEVNALNGEPGVKSARYAGELHDSTLNTNKLLKNMEDIKDRSARFRTVISVFIDGSEKQFEGICNGKIESTPKGTEGFGYDAVFMPDGSDKTFAEMTLQDKNKFSHRKKATTKFIEYIKNLDGQN